VTKDSNSVDFSGLVLGFSSAALYYMGESTVDGKSSSAVNLPLAKQNIDILLVLSEKTKNNLSAEESRLLSQVITDLQTKFIESSNKKV
jgi:hypothetical protein